MFVQFKIIYPVARGVETANQTPSTECMVSEVPCRHQHRYRELEPIHKAAQERRTDLMLNTRHKCYSYVLVCVEAEWEMEPISRQRRGFPYDMPQVKWHSFRILPGYSLVAVWGLRVLLPQAFKRWRDERQVPR